MKNTGKDSLLVSPFQHVTKLTVLLDTKGPEIRSGFFDGMDKLSLEKGQDLVMTGDYSYKAKDNTKLACSYDKLATSVTPGQQILLADGTLVLTVLSCDPSTKEVTCRVENSTFLGERKNMVSCVVVFVVVSFFFCVLILPVVVHYCLH